MSVGAKEKSSASCIGRQVRQGAEDFSLRLRAILYWFVRNDNVYL
jgi:hypothetical protein